MARAAFLRSSVLCSIALLALACSAGGDPEAATDSDSNAPGAGGSGGSGPETVGVGGAPETELEIDAGAQGGAAPACPALPAQAANPDVVMAAAFEADYTWLDLGAVPGVPGRLGGCVLKHDDPNKLLIAGDSEAQTGAIYEIGIQRDACDHIVGFVGTATKVADAPHVDANLVYGANDVLLYPQWPVNTMSQQLPGASGPAVTADMLSIGVDHSVSGLGFVPAYLPAAGGTRTLTWPLGTWFHIDLAFDGTLYSIGNPIKAATLEGGPGGFAYVPPGSPSFAQPSVIVAEWSVDKVSVYEVDAQGDPIVATRKEFFEHFPRPWGAYFDAVSGDYLFLTWGYVQDRVYVVPGFSPPPPPQVPN